MAHHSTPESMLTESLPEIVRAAEWCITTTKPAAPTGSVYGYPAAVLLCTAVSSIGSWVTSERGSRQQFSAALMDKRFFQVNIDRTAAEDVYDRVRNLLSHNSVLAEATRLEVGDESGEPIVHQDDEVVVNLKALLAQVRSAVDLIVRDPDKYVDEGARAKVDFDKKRERILKAVAQATAAAPAASAMATERPGSMAASDVLDEDELKSKIEQIERNRNTPGSSGKTG